MKPFNDLVLIKADKPKDQTSSGIILMEEWKSLPLTGEILEVGPKVTTVSKGQKVTFERYGSIILEDDQRLCKERHIFGVVDAERA